MLSEQLREKIKQVDILTDFDRVIIKEQSPYKQICAYYSSLGNFQERVNFTKKVIKGFYHYNITEDSRVFYSLLEGCPVEIVDNVVDRCHQNKWWDLLIEKLGQPRVGIISRNNIKIVADYLDKFEQPTEIDIISANIPEIKNGIYTGQVEMRVNKQNLADYIKEKDYICKEERKFLGNTEFTSKKVGYGLWICSKKKTFETLQWKPEK